MVRTRDSPPSPKDAGYVPTKADEAFRDVAIPAPKEFMIAQYKKMASSGEKSFGPRQGREELGN